MIDKIIKFAITYPAIVVLLTLASAGYGIYSFIQLPIDAVPDITNNQVQINTSLPGYSPLQMEKQVTYVIENALAGIPGLQMTRSLSRNSFSQVTAVFDDNVNLYFARQQINERLSEVKELLLPGAEPKMGPISTGLGEVFMWAIEFQHPEGSGANFQEGVPGWQEKGIYLTPEGYLLKTDIEKKAYLRTVQDWIIKPQLKGITGLAGIDSIGGYVRQYHVEPSLERMLALNLSFERIIEALGQNNQSIGPGYVERQGEGLLIKSDERLETADQIEKIIVISPGGVPVSIKDIAEVKVGKEMRSGSASKDGQETVIGTALMLVGGNSRTVAKAVEHKLQEVNQTLPPDIVAVPILNRTKLVNETIETVAKNLGEGALLVITVLLLFLGQFRAALITALVIPLSMLMTAIGMVKSGISGNLMSLGAIDFGLIVDGAVIITENCLRRLGKKQHELGRVLKKEERREELLSASREMIQPTVYGQAMIMVVYLPLLTLTGVEGKMFHPMAMTVLFALLAAFVLSLTFVPAAISLFVTSQVKEKENRMIAFLKKGYNPILNGVMAFPKSTIFCSAVLVAGSVWLFSQLGQEFVPTLDEGDIAMQATRSPSTSLTQSTKMQTEVEEVLKQFPEIAYVYSKTGTAEMASDPMPPNLSDTFLMLKPHHLWPDPELDKQELIERFSAKLEQLSGNTFEFTQPIEMRFNELISGIKSDVAVKIYGDDFDAMQKTAEKISEVLAKIPGAEDIKVSQTEGLPALEVKLDRTIASQLGLNVSDALNMLSIATGGGHAGQIFEGDRRYDILVKLPDMHDNLIAFESLPISLPGTSDKAHHFPHVPLGEIAKIQVSEGLNEVQRENGKRYVSVQANVRGRDLGSFVAQAKEEVQTNVEIPKGYWLGWGGQFENLISARERLMVVLPLCCGLILLLLYSALGSFKQAVLVFTAVPLALTGGMVALWIREMSFSISAAVGFIALSGIAVLNGLVLITCINQLLQQGMPMEQAIKQGSSIRLRPVLITALVASLGFIPMALASGTGAEVQKPLATVVIGGLISSTLLTLLMLPALYKLTKKA